jgi:hypothetical protein
MQHCVDAGTRTAWMCILASKYSSLSYAYMVVAPNYKLVYNSLSIYIYNYSHILHKAKRYWSYVPQLKAITNQLCSSHKNFHVFLVKSPYFSLEILSHHIAA